LLSVHLTLFLFGAWNLISSSLHLFYAFPWCTELDFFFPTPVLRLSLVHSLRNLFLYTILSAFLGAQIKKSLPLHHPRRFSWCTV
jgi:energy-converting hydrogenase Eha subunit A